MQIMMEDIQGTHDWLKANQDPPSRYYNILLLKLRLLNLFGVLLLIDVPTAFKAHALAPMLSGDR